MSESVVIKLVTVMISNFILFYKNSGIYKVLNFLSEKIKGLFQHSSIWLAVKSSERTSLFFELSMFYRITQAVFNWFIWCVRRMRALRHGIYSRSVLGKSLESSFIIKAFRNSLIGRIAGSFVGQFNLLLCLFVFIISVVPHNQWDNIYSTAMMVLITLLYMVKSSGDIRYGLDIRKLDFAFIIYVLAVAISVVTSITPASSMRIFAFNSTCFLFVFILVNSVKTKKELGSILYSIVAAITVASLYGIWQKIKGVPVDPLLIDISMGRQEGRVFSTMGNPNNYAEYLVMAIPFFAAAFFNTKNILVRIAIAGLALFAMGNLALTLSRSGILGLLAAGFVFVFLKNRKILPLLVLLGIAALPFMPASIIERMQTIGRDTSSKYRLYVWEGAYRMLKDFWLVGTGLGADPFRKLFNYYTNFEVPAHSHMLPLQIWLELGITGFLSFVWLLGRTIKKGIISIFERRDDYLNNIIAASIASISGILVIGFFEHVWFYPRVLNMFWIVMGIFLAALNLVYRQVSLAEKEY